ncbi:Alpha carbonic anhydrase [Trinorchestia longiramus]|nr:Alpha carbonic anhydrase [Trinorchestia longiramus]
MIWNSYLTEVEGFPLSNCVRTCHLADRTCTAHTCDLAAMNSFLCVALIFVVLSVKGTLAVDYTYSGKDSWGTEFPLHCAGTRQSPINIQRTATQWNFLNFLIPFDFRHYDHVPKAQYASNNFHTLAVTSEFDTKPTVSGGGLSGSYELLNMHFHWGSDESQGSEHTVDTVQYPLELHMVHAKKGVNLQEVLDRPDGLAVFGFFFEVSTQDNPALDHILRAAENVINGDSAEVETPYALTSLFPDDLRRYYRYAGSLTTPVCNEAVIWTVFKEPMHVSISQVSPRHVSISQVSPRHVSISQVSPRHVSISQVSPRHVSISQLNKLRQLADNKGNKIVNNFRSTQPLNGRTVYRSWM